MRRVLQHVAECGVLSLGPLQLMPKVGDHHLLIVEDISAQILLSMVRSTVLVAPVMRENRLAGHVGACLVLVEDLLHEAR